MDDLLQQELVLFTKHNILLGGGTAYDQINYIVAKEQSMCRGDLTVSLIFMGRAENIC